MDPAVWVVLLTAILLTPLFWKRHHILIRLEQSRISLYAWGASLFAISLLFLFATSRWLDLPILGIIFQAIFLTTLLYGGFILKSAWHQRIQERFRQNGWDDDRHSRTDR